MTTTKKYHISPETGRPNQCTATVRGCKYAENGEMPEHYDSKEDARKGYESQMKDQTLAPQTKKPVEETTETGQDFEEPVEGKVKYTITEDNIEKALNLVDRANNRLEKAGISDRFEYEMTEYEQKETVDGFTITRTYYDLEINTPVISYENEGKKHTFEAVMAREEAGIITRTGKGVELGGWKPDNLVCDHCGHRRPRNKTFIVKDAEGNRKQIGSTCVSAYLGVKVDGLWALGFDPLERDGDGLGNIPSQAPKHSTEDVLAVALAASNMGESFVSNKRAEENHMESTSSRVNWVMRAGEEDSEFNPNHILKEELRNRAAQLKESGEAKKFLDRIREIEATNDYTSNLNVLSNSEYISMRSRSTLISGIVAVKRAEWEAEKETKRKEAKQKQQDKFVPGHYGKVNEKIEKGTVFTLDNCSGYGAYDHFGNAITKYRITAKDSEGHQLIWFSGNPVEGDQGSEIKVSSGSIKQHGNYNDVDQTVLSRVRVVKPKK